jgi:AcrR family transcriptional regulator
LGGVKQSPPGPSRPRLTAVAITLAAIAIADAEGLEAVSIRRVAAELGARPMSLYRHIANKDELLDLMAEEVKQEIVIEQPLSEDWREALAMVARHYFEAFIGHPWAVLVFTRRARFGSSGTKLAKQITEAVAGLALEPDDVWLVGGTVNDVVRGYSLRAVSAGLSTQVGDDIAAADVVELPELASLRDSLRSRPSIERFEAGLQLLLDGVESRFGGDARRTRGA